MKFLKSILLVAAALTPLGAQPTIDISSHVVTAGSLANEIGIFAQADPTMILAKAPAPGAVRKVTQFQLQRWVTSLGVTSGAKDLPVSLVLRRTLRRLSESEVHTAIIASIAKAHHLDADLIAVDLIEPIAAQVPAGDISIECLCARLTLNEPTALRVRWREPGGRSGIERIRGVVTVYGEWLEAAVDLPTRTTIGPSDVVTRSGQLPNLKEYLSQKQLDGRWTLMRSVSQGEPLTSNFVRSIPLVSRGDLIELRFDSGGVRLRTAGRAEESGSTGALIAFRNIATGQRITARITNDQTAHVEAFRANR